MMNKYRVIIEDDGILIEQQMLASTADDVRKDVEESLSGIKIVDIVLIG